MFIIPQGSTITINGKVYRTLEAQVAWNTEQLQSMDIETLQNLPAAFAALSDDVDDLSDDLVAVSGQVTTNTDDILDLKGTVSGTGGITDQIHIINDNIENLLLDMGNAQDDIDDLEDAVAGKLDAPSAPGNLGDVIVLGSGDLPEWQAVAPFNPNGTYPGVTVGTATVAKNIENVSEDSGSDQTEPFFFQATATENNTGETPTAPQFELKNLRGNTIVYNQLVDGVNLTYATISGHKYWVYVSATDYTSIITSSGTSITVSDAQKDKIVDLTRWFNNSIPSAITDDPTVFPVNYYDDDLTYSAGELKNCSCTELETVGFNQINIADYEDNRYFDISKIIPGYVYCISVQDNTAIKIVKISTNAYDTAVWQSAAVGTSDKKITFTATEAMKSIGRLYLINASSQQASVTEAQNAKVNLNLSWDGERDGEYEPYISHTYPMVWSGKSAGYGSPICDELLPSGEETVRMASRTFNGTESWSEYGGAFYTSASAITDYKQHTDSAIMAISDKFVCRPQNVGITSLISSGRGNFAFRSDSTSIQFYPLDDTIVTVTDWKNWLANNPVTVYYELATPTTSSGEAYTSVIEGDDYGTMSFDSVVPVGNEFFYPADYALLVDDLNNYVNGDVTELAKMSDIPSVVIPDPPAADGNYTLKCDVTGGSPALYWAS